MAAVYNRPPGVPLITVTNHESCLDEPALLGNFMTLSQLLNQEKMRWSLAAHGRLKLIQSKDEV